ncbi:putative transcription factor cys6 [Erysiphe neolycopersici]|uniref:Putative transcription factor cys6 n=1 Tax=Erysiphe neolycopersici TaxID=212602 RepID=A0A420I319_9PEZI|nr:putative transcription factor cys6 [Erysiphe neolycopersici]
MESHEIESARSTKRKRSPVRYPIEENAGRSGQGNVTMINYMTKTRSERLRLMEGDNETFSDVLGLIDDYESVLHRHESLAANLGAKLVAPLLMKSFLKLFEGPIKVIQNSYPLSESPATWLDIVTFARTNPSEFVLIDSKDVPGEKVSRIWIRGGQIEISEDDYQLIMSGGPERMIPTQPIVDDELTEVCTLSILEARLAALIKKADAVASKARRLNYQIKGRQTAILSRKVAVDSHAYGEADTLSIPRNFPTISACTYAQTSIAQNKDTAQIQDRLLEQFLSYTNHDGSTQLKKPKSTQIEHDSRAYLPREARRSLKEVTNRLFMASRIEKLNRGDLIRPPCDRCRRLKFDCIKHLTACQACTKKHAKCSWRDTMDSEFDPSLETSQSVTESSNYIPTNNESRDSPTPLNSEMIGVQKN